METFEAVVKAAVCTCTDFRSRLRREASTGYVQMDLLHTKESTSDEDKGWTQTVDLSPLFLCLTLDVATEFLYGHSVHSLGGNTSASSTHSRSSSTNSPVKLNKLSSTSDPESSKRAEFGYHLDAGKSWICAKSFFGSWHTFITSPKFVRHCREVHRLVDGFVLARLSRPAQTSKSSGKFFLLDELAKHTQDPIELRNETLQVLNAGRDTTGSLLGWIFYFLTRHPIVFNKLRAMILADMGTYTDPDITFQKLHECKYLQHVINEVLRVVGVVPLNERVCLQDTVLPRGGGEDGSMPIFVPRGLRVLIAKYAMQHRSDLWGEDVEEFVPERWAGKRAGWEFMPFGGGPRKCIGREYLLFFYTVNLANGYPTEQFSLTEASYVTVRFLQRFDVIQNMEGPGDIQFHHTVSNRSGTGVQVRLHEALST